jgi:hypothetical protein
VKYITKLRTCWIAHYPTGITELILRRVSQVEIEISKCLIEVHSIDKWIGVSESTMAIACSSKNTTAGLVFIHEWLKGNSHVVVPFVHECLFRLLIHVSLRPGVMPSQHHTTNIRLINERTIRYGSITKIPVSKGLNHKRF